MSKEKTTKKRTRLSKRFLIFFFLLSVVCLFVLFQTKTDGISLSRIIYMVGSGISGNAEETTISFDSNDSNCYHLSKNGLFVLAPDGLRIYDISGEEKNFFPLAYRNPAISGGPKASAIYDRAGTNFLITNGKKAILSAKAPAPIISMDMNRNGVFSLITDGPDCKSLVTIFDNNCKEIYKLYSTEEYVAAAAVSPDSRRMVTLSFSVYEGQFQGKLLFYKLSEKTPYNAITLADTMPLSARFTASDELVVVCEDRLMHFSANGESKNEVSFDGFPIIFTANGSNKFSAIMLDKRNINNSYELIVSQSNLTEPYRIQFSEDIFSISSAGNYIAVQFLDRIVVYTSDLTEHHTFDIPAGARSSIIREDGTVLLIGTNWANLLIP